MTAKKQTGRNIRNDITPEGLAGKLERSGVSEEIVLKALAIMKEKKKLKEEKLKATRPNV